YYKKIIIKKHALDLTTPATHFSPCTETARPTAMNFGWRWRMHNCETCALEQPAFYANHRRQDICLAIVSLTGEAWAYRGFYIRADSGAQAFIGK
ncbi:MAG: hypothetical protein P8077_07005, partial [Gammaproteobacteria bacterium]